MRGKNASPGDTYVAANGYHYTRGDTKFILTHWLLAAEILGRPLNPKVEQAYFKDGDRTNLVKENIGVRPKMANGSRRRGQIRARIEQLMAEYVELDPGLVDDLQDMVNVFHQERSSASS